MRMLSRAAVVLAALAAVPGGHAMAASTPAPSPAPHAMPSVPYPKVPLHTEAVVEVNKKGQVVRIKSTKQSKSRAYNVQTFGNALQMWIRHPDGTAEVGLYRVTYDYDPKTSKIDRHVTIISSGGSWANDQGAATVMMEIARKQAAEAQKAAAAQQKKAQEQNAKLPTLNQIRGVPTSPSPKSATLPP